MFRHNIFDIASALFHVGGMSGAGAFLGEGHILSALVCALVAALCVLILAGAFAIAESIKKSKPKRKPRRRRKPTQSKNN